VFAGCGNTGCAFPRSFVQPLFDRRPDRFFAMSLDLSDVKRLSTLAQIELTEAESARTLDKLNGIFSLVEELRAVDTTGIAPLNHPIAAAQPALSLRLRDDVA